MNIEMNAHYWPNTPHLREIKLKVDGEVLYSKFLSCDDIWDLARQLRDLHDNLMDVGNAVHNETVTGRHQLEK